MNYNQNKILGACKSGDLKKIKYLIKEENTFLPQHVILELLRTACIKGHIKILKYFIKDVIDPDYKTEYYDYLLHFVVEHSEFDILKYLLDHGANVNFQNSMKLTPLHFACISPILDIIVFLLDNGADPNIGDIKNETPLHYLSQIYSGISLYDKIDDFDNTNPNVIKTPGYYSIIALIERGASVYTRTISGKTPYDLALNKKSYSLVEKIGLQRMYRYNPKIYSTLKRNKLIDVEFQFADQEYSKKRLRIKSILEAMCQ